MDYAYLSTTAAEEWNDWAGRNLEVSGGSVGIATEPTISYTNLRVEAIDVTVDQDGNVLTLDDTGTVYSYDRGNERTEVLREPTEGDDVGDPRAICVFGNRIYTADGDTGDLVVLSRRDGEIVGRMDARLVDPVDVVRSDQRIYLLDDGAGADDGRILTLRRSGMVETVVRGLASPVDIAADGSHLYVVERPEHNPVVRIHDVGHIESPSILPTSRTIEELTVEGSDHAVVPVRVGVLADQELVLVGRLAGTGERALYHYTFDQNEWTLERRDEFALTCSELLTGPRRQDRRYPNYYAIAGEQSHVYVIDERQTTRRNAHDDRYSAQAFRRFDSGSVDTEWDRLMLELDAFPANTQVVASYHARNDPADGELAERVDDVSGSDADALQAAGIEGCWDLLEAAPATVADALGDADTDRVEALRAAAVEAVDGDEWTSPDAANRRDVLLEDVEGRYLHVRLELIGSVDASPQVGSFRAYCPKRTYLRYLPEVFRTRGRRKRFLERYLSVFESEFVDIEEEIERVTRYFDPDGVPSEYLEWLGDWLAIEYDEEWPEGAKRAFLREAPELFRRRGTKPGLDRTIRLYLEHVEAPDTSWMSRWQKRRIEARRSDGYLPDEAARAAFDAIDETTAGYGDGHMLFFLERQDLDGIGSEAAREPYAMHMRGSRSFVVFVGPFVSRSHHRSVARVVSADKPAHAHGRVVETEQELKLEGRSFLGINSTLTTREFVLGDATLGGDAVLRERGSPLSGGGG